MSVEPAEAQNEMDERLVSPDQKSIHRVFASGVILPRMSRRISTGTRVTPSSAAKNIEKVLVKASGLNKRPSCAVERKDRNETDGDDQQREEERATDALGRGNDNFDAFAVVRFAAVLFPEMFQRLVRVLDHDDGGIDHRADRDGDAAERHDVGRQMPSQNIGRNESKDRDRQRDDRDQRGADVPEENEADQGDDDAFLDQFLAQRGDGRLISSLRS